MVVGAFLLAPSFATALQPCEGDNCAEVRVVGASAPAGQNATIRVTFTQAPNDGVDDQGPDDVAAVAFSIGIPGTGDSQALGFSAAGCLDADGNGLPDAISIPNQQIRDGFRVVVENAECAAGTCGCGPSRESCLCPGEGQTRQDFVNVVVFSPKDLPPTGPVTITKIPDGELLRLSLRIDPETPEGDVPIHVFAETDAAPVTKPQFAANLSIGDLAAIDQTADRPNDRSKVRFIDGAVNVGPPLLTCPGDCDENGTVEVAEVITSVNIALDNMPITACSPVDINQNNVVGIDELIGAVDKSLTNCP
jgi:hypothetical protein